MVPQTKVFVGSLPQGSKPEELRRLFEQFGEVTECDIMNRCGFVHMATEDQAAAAIRGLHNATFNGALITVEKGRIKERGARGPGGPGPMRGGGGGGGMRNGMGDMARRPGGGGPMRGLPMGGGRDPAPYMRDSRPPMRGGDMRGPPMSGGGSMGGSMGGMRNGMGGGGYDAYPEDRYDSYGGDGRGYAMMDRGDVGYGGGMSRDAGYGAPVSGSMYADDRRGYGMSDRAPLYPEERHAPMYPDERDMMDRRGGMRAPMSMAPAYDRSLASPMGNGDMYSRRSPPAMRGGSGGYGDRDAYSQQYPPMGRDETLLRIQYDGDDVLSYGASSYASQSMRPTTTRVSSNITLLGGRH